MDENDHTPAETPLEGRWEGGGAGLARGRGEVLIRVGEGLRWVLGRVLRGFGVGLGHSAIGGLPAGGCNPELIKSYHTPRTGNPAGGQNKRF